MSTIQPEFGRRLRDERECRGLTLQAIADSTKIPLSLLAGLERGDIEDWPSGLFGRAHFRAYAAAVGLSAEPLMIEFLGLFGNDTAPIPTPAPSPLTPDGGPRLTLAEDRHSGIKRTGMRALAVALDLCVIFAVAAGFARILQTDLSLACALVSLTYYALTTVALGQSVTLWWLGERVPRRAWRSTPNEPKLLLMPRRRLRASRRQEGPVDFRENPSPVAQAASR